MARKIHKAELPGEIYQKAKGWWWKVRLPGESRIKSRALKAKGARFATTQLNEAKGIALELWEVALEKFAKAEVRAQAQAKAREEAKSHSEEIAKIKAEAAQTTADQKAVFAEKVKAYTEAVNEAQEKAKSEAEARAQAEAKLAELQSGSARMGSCECCGRDDVPEEDLHRIDSGQLFCPDCLSALRS